MKEQSITLETAKLAKEKGFRLLVEFESSYPTQSLLQKWLWETFLVHVSVIPIKRRDERQIYFQYRVIDFGIAPLDEMEVLCEHQYNNSFDQFESPYLCWEKGLQEALRLI